MIEQIYTYFSIEMIYLWLNIGVVPFWILLFFFPQTKLCKIFVTSIFPILIFAVVDLYLILEIYKTGFNLLNGFNLYLFQHELRSNMGAPWDPRSTGGTQASTNNNNTARISFGTILTTMVVYARPYHTSSPHAVNHRPPKEWIISFADPGRKLIA